MISPISVHLCVDPLIEEQALFHAACYQSSDTLIHSLNVTAREDIEGSGGRVYTVWSVTLRGTL